MQHPWLSGGPWEAVSRSNGHHACEKERLGILLATSLKLDCTIPETSQANLPDRPAPGRIIQKILCDQIQVNLHVQKRSIRKVWGTGSDFCIWAVKKTGLRHFGNAAVRISRPPTDLMRLRHCRNDAEWVAGIARFRQRLADARCTWRQMTRQRFPTDAENP